MPLADRKMMRTITTTEDLAAFCTAAKSQPYVTIDTEFLRERTYWSKLCLIQMALPGKTGDAVLVDPILGEDMSMEPLYDLFRHKATVKVFHAARQDLEIFFVEGNVFPDPLFDTQIAAMVCGFGEQVGYETLVKKIAKENLDKTSRFTDWSRRPLSDAQQEYALADVTHLRVIYEWLAAQLANAVATLAGRGGVGIIGRLRQGFGLDDLDVQTGADGGATVRAGKYLSENVYTEVEVDDRGESQINLNLDVTDSVTIRGSTGTTGDTGLGVYFEKDY